MPCKVTFQKLSSCRGALPMLQPQMGYKLQLPCKHEQLNCIQSVKLVTAQESIREERLLQQTCP